MAGFILALIVLLICGLLFGKADTKKNILNQVGLDLSQNRYETKKEDEFCRYALQAMRKCIDDEYYNAKDERSFLGYMSRALDKAAYGSFETNAWGEEEYKAPTNLGVKKHYIEHAYRVISRRENAIKAGKATYVNNIDFTNKSSAKSYCKTLSQVHPFKNVLLS